jgi:hypothetical protein
MAATSRHAPLANDCGVSKKGVVLARGQGLFMPSALDILLKKSSRLASSDATPVKVRLRD